MSSSWSTVAEAWTCVYLSCWWKKSQTTTWNVYNPIKNVIYYRLNWWVRQISDLQFLAGTGTPEGPVSADDPGPWETKEKKANQKGTHPVFNLFNPDWLMTGSLIMGKISWSLEAKIVGRRKNNAIRAQISNYIISTWPMANKFWRIVVVPMWIKHHVIPLKTRG